MRQKKIFLFLILAGGGLGLTFTSAPADAGVRSSGGGKAVVCRTQGNVESVELLDLFEARTVRGLTLSEPMGSFEDEYVEYVRRINVIATKNTPNGASVRSRQATLAHLRETFARFVVYSRPGTILPDTGDAGTTARIPEGCALEQAAVYDDRIHELTLDPALWLAMDEKNRAALVAHEESYFGLRKAGDRTSENVRRIVGALFSTNPLPSFAFEPGSGSFLCFANSVQNPGLGATFSLRSDPDSFGSTTLRFSRLSGRDTLIPVTLDVPVALRVESLKPVVADDIPGSPAAGAITRVSMVVSDLSADFAQELPLADGVFNGHTVLLTYRTGTPLRLQHLDERKKVLSDTQISACFAR